MKLSLALTTLLLSSTAFAKPYEITCYDKANTQLFTIHTARLVDTSVTWKDGSKDPANMTKTESVKQGGCFDHYSLGMTLEDLFHQPKFKIEIASHWTDGQQGTRCAGSSYFGGFDGSLTKDGKTIEITCKDLKGLGL